MYNGRVCTVRVCMTGIGCMGVGVTVQNAALQCNL